MGETTQKRRNFVEKLLTAQQAADFLNISRSHFWRLRRRYGIPTVRIGKGLRFRPEALHAWVLGCEESLAQGDAGDGSPAPADADTQAKRAGSCQEKPGGGTGGRQR